MDHPDKEVAFAAALAAHRSDSHRLRHDSHAHEYYQTSLLSALMRGVYDGKTTIGGLLEHGDLGLGTFNGLDGEMIVLDGKAYRQSGDGSAALALDSDRTPYAAVVSFIPDHRSAIDEPHAKPALEACFDAWAASPNLFYALRFDGHFSTVRFRNVVKQEPPYKPLLEVIATQREHELTDVRGTMVGFRCPDYAVGIGVPGYHLHFITDNRTRGGHVLDYEVTEGNLEIDHTSTLHLELPETEAFSHADLRAGSSSEAIEQVESKPTGSS